MTELNSSSEFIYGRPSGLEMPNPLIVVRKCEDAVLPTRANPSDIGMDLVAINMVKEMDNGVVLYDTGLQISPPNGYYIEIIPRSSISKTGWILANSVGIIDPEYTGNLMIALARLNPDTPKIPTPFCKCQLVVRKAEYLPVVEASTLNQTSRGDGGFGSTGDRVTG